MSMTKILSKNLYVSGRFTGTYINTYVFKLVSGLPLSDYSNP